MSGKPSDRLVAKGIVGDRSGDLEIDPGYHHIFQGETKVGEIFFLPETNVEHWVLFAEYTYPSSRNTRVDMTFCYIGMPGEDDPLVVPPDLTTFLGKVPVSAARMALTIAWEP